MNLQGIACMRNKLRTPIFRCLLIRHDDHSHQKFVLIAPILAAPIPTQYIIVEVPDPAEPTLEWLGITHGPVAVRKLVTPFFAQDGGLMFQRWNCLSSIHPIGNCKLVWNGRDGLTKLVFPRLDFLATVAYFCFNERYYNPLEQLDLYINETGRNEPSNSSAQEEIHASTSQASTATPEHDLAKLLPSDPFEMGYI